MNNRIDIIALESAKTGVVQRERYSALVRTSVVITLVLIAYTLFFGCLYKFLGIDIGIFRAESGIYLAFSYATPEMQKDFISKFVWISYNGHFAPIIFWLEFMQSKLFQANGELWFWRQMFSLSLMASSITFLVIWLSRYFGSRKAASIVVAISTALIFVSQPIFLDLVSWPFMGLQFLCISLMGLAALFLFRFCVTRQSGDLAGFLFSSYATMHVSGVGFSISASALAVSTIVIALLHLSDRDESKKIRTRLLLLSASAFLTLCHAVIMVTGGAPAKQLESSVDLSHSIYRFGTLFQGSIDAAIKSLWSNGGYVWPRVDLVSVQGIYGVGLAFALILVVMGIGFKYYQKREVRDLLSFGLTAFALISLLVYVLLITFRMHTDPNDASMIGYFVGSRYLIYPSFFILVFCIGAILQIRRVFGAFSSAVFAVVACTSLFATISFAHNLLPTIWPHLLVNQQAIWDKVVDDARENVAKGLPVKNENLDALGMEFHFETKGFRYLIDKQLGCKDCVKFE